MIREAKLTNLENNTKKFVGVFEALYIDPQGIIDV